MQQSFKDIAERIVTAENDFLDSLMRCGGITREEAVKVMKVYRKAKVLKNEYAVSRIAVKHGGFLDKEVIQRALAS